MPSLHDLCDHACWPGQPEFEIPPPGSPAEYFVQAQEKSPVSGLERRFYAIHPKNHDLGAAAEPHFNPSVAIVGLSAADTQIAAFVATYARTGSYDKAARDACFKGLVTDIINMLEATGAADRLKLRFDLRDTFNRHHEVLCDSLVKCAALDLKGDSTDWRPGDYEIATACVRHRFVANMLNPRFTRLKSIVLLGDKAKTAIETLRVDSGLTVREHLEAAGKTFYFFPHPSGGNREYVKLAQQHPLPEKNRWIDEKWKAYVAECRRKGKEPVAESSYRGKRSTTWNQINDLRRQFGR